jgi:hypothetical protein
VPQLDEHVLAGEGVAQDSHRDVVALRVLLADAALDRLEADGLVELVTVWRV